MNATAPPASPPPGGPPTHPARRRFVLAGVWLVAAGIAVALFLSWRPTPFTGTVLITGANRGIGLALAREYAGRGWTVIATARDPGRAEALAALARDFPAVRIERLDVTSPVQIAELRDRLAGMPIDVLLNNAGTNANGEGQAFGELDYDILHAIMAVNLEGPLRMAEVFLPNVLASRQKKIIVISSIQGSITRSFGGAYAYRASKAALNMVMRTLAVDLRREGVIVGILSPGIVENDRNRNMDFPKMKAEDSARALADRIEELTARQSGMFLEYNGDGLPW